MTRRDRPKVPSPQQVLGTVTGTVTGTVAGATRRQQYSASTKRALVDVAGRLFTEQGYAGTSLDAIVGGAEVTKGALYHHFDGKQALFEAVFERVEQDATKAIAKAMRGGRTPWDKATAGLQAFLDAVQEPTYRRVVVQEGPAVLGYARYRERKHASLELIQDMVSSVLGGAGLSVDDGMVETFSRIFFGALGSAGEAVADAEDARLARARVQSALAYLLTGLRRLAEDGEELLDPEALLGPADGVDGAARR